MKIIIVDDERLILQMMRKNLAEVLPDCEPTIFEKSQSALEYAKENNVDIAFLDIDMPGIYGIDLAKELKKIHPLVNVIFCTAYSEFMQDAIDLHASGYILKPTSAEAIKKAVDNLLHPVEKPLPQIFVRTFGDFDLFINGVCALFKSKKSKELFAYLVHKRGGIANKKELAAALFEDSYSDSTQTYLKRIYRELNETLIGYGVETILVKGFNQYAVDTTKFTCDAYDYDKGLPYAVNAYKGEYMAQYEWADLE